MSATREFVLFLAVLGVLVLGIVFTVGSDLVERSASQTASVALVAATPVDEVEAVADVVDPAVVRAARQEELREQVMAYRAQERDNSIFIVREGQPELPLEDEDRATDQIVSEVVLCPYYAPFAGFWPRGIEMVVDENGRSFYQRLDGLAGEDERTLLLQLPLPIAPTGSRCVPSDVVGVANDGSLIRNNETSLYGIFGGQTVVGYALDGFPIYGRDDGMAVDACGGAYGVAGYGYVLQSQRSTILNCFSGTPVAI